MRAAFKLVRLCKIFGETKLHCHRLASEAAGAHLANLKMLKSKNGVRLVLETVRNAVDAVAGRLPPVPLELAVGVGHLPAVGPV